MHTYRPGGVGRWLVIGAAAGLAGLTLASVARVSAEPSAPGAVACAWERLPTGERRSQHTLTYLPDSAAVAAFAGGEMRRAGDKLSDDLHTLKLDAPGAAWTRINLSGGPGDRMQHSSVLRQIPGGGQQMVVYGGVDALPGGGGTGTWKSPILATGPATGLLDTYAPSDVVDTVHMLGFSPTGDPASWTSADIAGQSRADHSAVWAPSEDAMITFGGRRTEAANTAENSVWAYTFGGTPTWTRVNASGGPSARFAHTAVYQDAAVRMIVFGGTNNWTTGMNDVWALKFLNGFASAEWVEVETTGTPPRARYDHAAVYVPELDWMIVVGGTANGQAELSDVYALDMSTDPSPWIRLAPTGNGPPGLQALAGSYDTTGRRAVFHGGQVGADSRDQTWALTCTDTSVGTATPTSTATETLPGDTVTPTPSDTEVTPVDTLTATATSVEVTPGVTEGTPTGVPTVVTPGGGMNVYLPNVRKHE